MTSDLPRERVRIVLPGGFTVTVGAREVADPAWPSPRSAQARCAALAAGPSGDVPGSPAGP